MTELEMTVEALKRCIPSDKYEAALQAVKAGIPAGGEPANQPPSRI